MSLFSQRKGIRPLQKAIQRESMDEELRNRLWSAMQLMIWDNWSARDRRGFQTEDALRVEQLILNMWLNYFKEPTDTVPDFISRNRKDAYHVLRERFFECEWWEAYDFLEVVIKFAHDPWAASLVNIANKFLEAENAAYRIVGREIVEITDELEIEAIESATETAIRSVQTHLRRALELLADRRQPDYRNSIKEAISAVEAVCQVMSTNNKGTLGDCLRTLKDKTLIHPALEGAFLKLYGYTSDEGGIRHALADGSEQPSFADAKFMLVACSAFTNFLWTKAAESGMVLPKS